MANEDDYEDREPRLWPNPIELVKSLVANSPEMNVKVALINMIDFLAGDEDDVDSDERRAVDANDLMEVIAQSITYLHHHVGEEEEVEEDLRYHLHLSGDTPAVPAPTAEELIKRFREQLGETEAGEK